VTKGGGLHGPHPHEKKERRGRIEKGRGGKKRGLRRERGCAEKAGGEGVRRKNVLVEEEIEKERRMGKIFEGGEKKVGGNGKNSSRETRNVVRRERKTVRWGEKRKRGGGGIWTKRKIDFCPRQKPRNGKDKGEIQRRS